MQFAQFCIRTYATNVCESLQPAASILGHQKALLVLASQHQARWNEKISWEKPTGAETETTKASKPRRQRRRDRDAEGVEGRGGGMGRGIPLPIPPFTPSDIARYVAKRDQSRISREQDIGNFRIAGLFKRSRRRLRKYASI